MGGQAPAGNIKRSLRFREQAMLSWPVMIGIAEARWQPLAPWKSRVVGRARCPGMTFRERLEIA